MSCVNFETPFVKTLNKKCHLEIYFCIRIRKDPNPWKEYTKTGLLIYYFIYTILKQISSLQRASLTFKKQRSLFSNQFLWADQKSQKRNWLDYFIRILNQFRILNESKKIFGKIKLSELCIWSQKRHFWKVFFQINSLKTENRFF